MQSLDSYLRPVPANLYQRLENNTKIHELYIPTYQVGLSALGELFRSPTSRHNPNPSEYMYDNMRIPCPVLPNQAITVEKGDADLMLSLSVNNIPLAGTGFAEMIIKKYFPANTKTPSYAEQKNDMMKATAESLAKNQELSLGNFITG